MNLDDLKQKWALIESLPRQGDYDLVLVSSESYAEVSLAISPDANRCLVLALPIGYEIDFREIVRENICLSMVPERNYVSVTLLDTRFIDLFDDLIISIHNAIFGIHSVNEYCSVFLKTFNKWSQFFERMEHDKLPDSVIRGIFGEIIVLQKFMADTSASEINSVLESWRGPYDQGQDFLFEDRNVEVKTRSVMNSSIKITSENQLDQTEGKGLELVVVTLEANVTEGQTLATLVQKIVKIIEGALGDSTIFYRAMGQKNLGPKNLDDYDHLSFRTHKIYRYDCLLESFPRLVRSELPLAVFGIKYSLNTSELEDYLIEEIEI